MRSVGSLYHFRGLGRGQSQPGLPRCTFQSWPQVHIIWECLIHSDYFIPGGCKQLLSGGESGRERDYRVLENLWWERKGVVMDRWWLNL